MLLTTYTFPIFKQSWFEFTEVFFQKQPFPQANLIVDMGYRYFHLFKVKFTKVSTHCSVGCIIEFEQENTGWVVYNICLPSKDIGSILSLKAYNMQNLNQVKYIRTPEDRCSLKVETKNTWLMFWIFPKLTKKLKTESLLSYFWMFSANLL